MNGCELIINYWNKSIPSYTVSKNGEISIKKLLNSFTEEEIIKAIDIAIAEYVFYEGEVINEESVALAFNKISGVCACLKDDVLAKAFYIRGILRNRFEIEEEFYLQIVDLIKKAYIDGYTLESIEESARNTIDFYDWYIMMNEREDDANYNDRIKIIEI